MTTTKRASPEDRLKKLLSKQSSLAAAIEKQKRIAAEREARERQRKLLAAGAVIESAGMLDRLDDVAAALASYSDTAVSSP